MSKFILACVIAFIAGVAATAYFIHTMSDEMPMAGGWNMCMMWMRMPGQTWVMATLSFLLMWLAMMLAMMMPSALPLFLKTGQNFSSLCFIAMGYFTVWLLAGLPVYAVGIALNDVAMRSEIFSRAIPFLAGASLIAAGIIQLTRWKLTQLSCCRSPFGCAAQCAPGEKGFRLGCRQGVACCKCCAALMAIQLILGIMNPLVMAVVALVIASEKHFPRPVTTARVAGLAAIIAGIIIIIA